MAISFVNAAANFNGSSAASIAAPATSLTAGNLIVVAVRFGSTNIANVSGISDTAGNAYRFVVSTISNSAGVGLWYSANVSGNASNVVTASFSPNLAATSIVTMQFSGLNT